ncbi:MAG: hypothetical protein Ct9H300mP8_10340 [Gammaproteobacteria bacterium]|nr:MAG: hypothetical protein Ct9H300mP8_10340 [Gammaproteobacteria bacterium]
MPNRLKRWVAKRFPTIEDLGNQHPALVKVWAERNVAQCGYCQAGQLMSAAALLASNLIRATPISTVLCPGTFADADLRKNPGARFMKSWRDLMTIHNLSRRNFMVTTGGLVLGAALPTKGARPDALNLGDFKAEPLRRLGCNGHRYRDLTPIGNGTGNPDRIAQIIADEMEANWSHVVVAQAQGDKAYGDQNTDGSQSIRLFLDKLRRAGALRVTCSKQRPLIVGMSRSTSARQTTISLNINLRVKSWPFGELAAEASNLSVPRQVTLKAREDFRYIGKGMKHVDADAIAAGTANYAADVRLPEMAVAVIVRPPLLGVVLSHLILIKKRKVKLGSSVLKPSTRHPGPLCSIRWEVSLRLPKQRSPQCRLLKSWKSPGRTQAKQQKHPPLTNNYTIW